VQALLLCNVLALAASPICQIDLLGSRLNDERKRLVRLELALLHGIEIRKIDRLPADVS
jgi:hypothetical protein